MSLRFLFVVHVLLLVQVNGFAKEGTAGLTMPPNQPMPIQTKASQEERNVRIQLMKALEAELQARTAERNAPPAAPLAKAAFEAPPGSMQYKGLLGDYWGGVYGTIIAAITSLLVLITWRTTRKNDNKTKTYQVFTEMLRTHEEIVTSMRIGEAVGREAIALLLSEFSFIYKATQSHVPEYDVWSMHDRVDIAYTYMYYGPQLQTQRVLSGYDPALLKLIGDAVSAKQQRNSRSIGARQRQRLFKGHQNRISHYFRNLFAAYKFIDSSDLSELEKKDLGKVLRAKLSNYEQALLLLNVMSNLGKPWITAGLLNFYEPIKNVPRNFFSFDEQNFDLKVEFPDIDFEWTTKVTPGDRGRWSAKIFSGYKAFFDRA